MATWKSGSRGKVDVDGEVLKITGWAFDPKAEIHEVTNTDSYDTDEVYEEFISGIVGATCSFTANWDLDQHPTDNPPNLSPGKRVVLKFYLGDTAKFIQATALIEGLPMVSGIKDTLKYTCNARVTGRIIWPS